MERSSAHDLYKYKFKVAFDLVIKCEIIAEMPQTFTLGFPKVDSFVGIPFFVADVKVFGLAPVALSRLAVWLVASNRTDPTVAAFAAVNFLRSSGDPLKARAENISAPIGRSQ